MRPPRLRCTLFPLIYPPHLLGSYKRQLYGFVLFSRLTKRNLASYVISVRRTKSLLTASFRFYLTIDTLAVQLYTSLSPRRVRVGSSDGAVVSVSIACHLKPCMRFSLTRLSDNLLPTAFKRLPHIFSCLDNKSTLFHWLHTTFEIHTAHVLCISSVFACNIPVSIASSTRIHQAV